MNQKSINLLTSLSTYLNDNPKAITLNQINKVAKVGVNDKEALRILLNEYLEGDFSLLNDYYSQIVNLQKENDYTEDLYYKQVKFKNKKFKNIEIKIDKYDPYELFVYDDFSYIDGYVIPKIGYFKKPFYYPAIYENGNMWMSITPNEINTISKAIKKAYGNVLTFGLGLGYFAFMASIKNEVSSVTIIEKNPKTIEIFKEYIFPFFKYKHKINIICIDAYEYIKEMKSFDYIFVDIYHDASDGILCYKKMMKNPKIKDANVDFWIYDTIKYYLD